MVDWSHSAHSFATALALAKASQAAYDRSGAAPAKWAADQGFQVKGPFDARNMYGFAAANNDTIVFAFRGTDQGSDWKVNANLDKKSVKGLPGKIHDGFWADGLQPLFPAVSEALNAKPYKKIWITGHSLGGAIAVLLQASLIFQHSRMVTGVYTFGQPRVGNQAFRDRLDAQSAGQYYRYVNHNDIVPLVPPFSLDYRHGGSPLRFGRDGKVQNRDNLLSRLSGFFDEMEDQLDSLVHSKPADNLHNILKEVRGAPSQGVREHGIGEYIGLIERTIAAGRK